MILMERNSVIRSKLLVVRHRLVFSKQQEVVCLTVAVSHFPVIYTPYGQRQDTKLSRINDELY